ncbi:nitrite reductase [Vibrio sp. ZSDE26]|uniref:Nitrite reductase n=1 Tax=Vibrio amylolyticus TaxID=2847292 RepID=A0A9X2BN02_9VIBR|nr:nitrite reductase [Vibrio amylolyticus]MCK6265448.1 nitrite reductase [Vibrio amylolyticus]
MQTSAVLLLLLVSVLSVLIFSQSTSLNRRKAAGFGVLVCVITAFLYSVLYKPMPTEITVGEMPKSHSEAMQQIQTKLTQDPNQQGLWFQLGNGYLRENDFQSALTSFDYSIRLSESASANQLSAKASALYYLSSQRMTSEVEGLLQRALTLDSTNTTALTLIANDHLLGFRHQQAIDTWVQLLDSQQTDLNRVAIIESINHAKSYLPKN